MLRNVATNTNVIFYLMAVVGVLGVLVHRISVHEGSVTLLP